MHGVVNTRAYHIYTHTHTHMNIIYFLIDIEEALSRQRYRREDKFDRDPIERRFGSVRSPWWTSIHRACISSEQKKRILLSLLSNRRGLLHFHRGESEWNASIFLIGASVFDARARRYTIYIGIYQIIPVGRPEASQCGVSRVPLRRILEGNIGFKNEI